MVESVDSQEFGNEKEPGTAVVCAIPFRASHWQGSDSLFHSDSDKLSRALDLPAAITP